MSCPASMAGSCLRLPGLRRQTGQRRAAETWVRLTLTFQQPRRQQGLPILASFSEAHPEYVPSGVDVTHFELCGFGDAESRAVEHGQHGAMPETAGGLQ